MITGSILLPAPPTFRALFSFVSSPLSEILEQAMEMWLRRSVRTTVRTLTTCKQMSSVTLDLAQMLTLICQLCKPSI